MRRLVLILLLSPGSVGCHAPGVSQSPAHVAGDSVRFLTSDPAAIDYWPCFSADGKAVLFSRTLDRGKTWALFTVPVSGGAAHQITGSTLPASPTRPNRSAHSGRIAFTAQESDEKATVWIMSLDGSRAEQITATGLSDRAWYPSWYPDDTHLAVVDDRQLVMRIDLERHTATALTDTVTVLAGMPSVSPDGKRIAFAGQRNRGQEYDQTKNTIWLLEEDGSLRNLVPGQGRTPAWSPDGEWLAFESNRGNTRDLYAAFIVRRDGTGLRQVTRYELNANHPVWSPDGTLLAVSAQHTKDSAVTGIALIRLRDP